MARSAPFSRGISRVPPLRKIGRREDIAEVTLVVLHYQTQVQWIVPLVLEVVPHVQICLNIVVQAIYLRIHNEDDAVNTLDNKFAAGVVLPLAGHRIQMKS